MPQQRKRRANPSLMQRTGHWMLSVLAGAARLFTPGARGVYPPHSNSLIVLGVALPPGVDKDELGRRLWWRGLGIIERDRHAIAGADITAAVHKRRVRQARQFVIKQLRNAGVRGTVSRWDHASLGNRGQGTGDRGQASRKTQAPKRTNTKKRTTNNNRNPNPKSKI
jgi:hypothetical protein